MATRSYYTMIGVHGIIFLDYDENEEQIYINTEFKEIVEHLQHLIEVTNTSLYEHNFVTRFYQCKVLFTIIWARNCFGAGTSGELYRTTKVLLYYLFSLRL